MCGYISEETRVRLQSDLFGFISLCRISVCMSVLPVTYICVYHIHALGDQKKALDLLELELKTVVSLAVGAENLTWVICKSIKCFNY